MQLTHKANGGSVTLTNKIIPLEMLLGVSSPTTFSGYKTLHFKNASGDTAFLNETDGGVIHETLTSDSNSCAFTGTRSAHALKFRTNQYERMSIVHQLMIRLMLL